MKFLSILAASLGGFQFGYNTAIISGALLFLAREFSLSVGSEGFAVSAILLGALGGAYFGGWAANRWGRKKAIGFLALFSLLGTVLVGAAPSVQFFILGRFIQGLGVGMVSVVTPMYLAEIAPTKRRGFYVSCNQFAITIGILTAYGCNYGFAASGNWRMMFGLAFIPALFQLLALPFISESPSWRPQLSMPSWKGLLNFRFLVVIGTLLSIFQQITGINAVIYFAPKIFQDAGFTTSIGAILATVGIGVVNVLATILALWLIDKAGRRPLLLVSLSGMVISLFAIALAFFTSSPFIDRIAIVGLITYVAFFAIGMGPIPWLVVAEIYPLQIRGQAMSLATFSNWLANYFVALTFLDIAKYLTTGGAFCIFAAFGLIALFFVLKYLPETKGKSLFEENLDS